MTAERGREDHEPVTVSSGTLAPSPDGTADPSAYDGFESNRIRHLEMIQAVISRLGSNGFLIKGSSVTVSGALLGFTVNQQRWELGALATGAVVVFWGLDTYFLRAERLFRVLFECVRTGANDVAPFFMGATGDTFVGTVRSSGKDDVASWRSTAKRPTLAGFYGLLMLCALLVTLLVGMSGKDADGKDRPAMEAPNVHR